MPITRLLFTMREVREMIAKKYRVGLDGVITIEGLPLKQEVFPGSEVFDLEDNSYIFQLDK
jgi:hypothetical protein